MNFRVLFLAVALVVLAVVSAVDARTCAFRDACNRKLIIKVNSGRRFKDSCRKTYKVSSSCKLRRVCSFKLKCLGKKRRSFLVRSTFRDLCGRKYLVSTSCKLIRK